MSLGTATSRGLAQHAASEACETDDVASKIPMLFVIPIPFVQGNKHVFNHTISPSNDLRLALNDDGCTRHLLPLLQRGVPYELHLI